MNRGLKILLAVVYSLPFCNRNISLPKKSQKPLISGMPVLNA